MRIIAINNKMTKHMPSTLYKTERGSHKTSPKATAISMATAGSFPIELAQKNASAEMRVKAAPAVTAPDGTNGKMRSDNTAHHTLAGG